MTTARTLLDNLFTPDIRVKITEDDSIITACEALTPAGADYLTHNAIMGLSYDNIPPSDLCFEIIEA